MKRGRPPEDPDSAQAAYLRALRWLAARELSESQVRDRLAAHGYTAGAIQAAIERLLQDRTIDDRRAATAVARTEHLVKRHGPHRVLATLIAIGIDRDLAKDVVGELFGETDDETLLGAVLERRLRGKLERLRDPAERRKLLAYLIRQGFSASAAASIMRKLSK